MAEVAESMDVDTVNNQEPTTNLNTTDGTSNITESAIPNGHSHCAINQKNPTPPQSEEESISSPQPPPTTSQSKEDTLTKAERALQQLLDHSHELTTKLRENLNSKQNGKSHRNKNRKSTISEEAENAQLLNDQDTDSPTVITHFENGQQPSSISGGTMYDYQIEALNWMIQLFELNRTGCYINGILADDMGLGKTLMTISMLSYLKQMDEKKEKEK